MHILTDHKIFQTCHISFVVGDHYGDSGCHERKGCYFNESGFKCFFGFFVSYRSRQEITACIAIWFKNQELATNNMVYSVDLPKLLTVVGSVTFKFNLCVNCSVTSFITTFISMLMNGFSLVRWGVFSQSTRLSQSVPIYRISFMEVERTTVSDPTCPHFIPPCCYLFLRW